MEHLQGVTCGTCLGISHSGWPPGVSEKLDSEFRSMWATTYFNVDLVDPVGMDDDH